MGGQLRAAKSLGWVATALLQVFNHLETTFTKSRQSPTGHFSIRGIG